ncbi:MAG: putative Ig domain-containing protein, partial [Mycobacteriaceae bacterium]
MTGNSGRWAEAVVGVVLIVLGVVLGGGWWALAVIGLAPLTACVARGRRRSVMAAVVAAATVAPLILGVTAPAAAVNPGPQNTYGSETPVQAAAVHARLAGGAPGPAPLQGHRHTRVCGAPSPRQVACDAIIDLDVAGPLATPAAAPAGYGPGDLQAAYNLPSTTAGSGRTVAIVDAYDLPTAQNDLNTYRAEYGLPPCGAGCFTKVNQNGGSTPPAANASWGQEIALDLDMVSAACPNCKILLVEASSNSVANLGTAVNTAVEMGAVAVSNSYGGLESSSETSWDASYFLHPGVAITASSGDDGYGVHYPAASQYVTAVGGTSLTGTSTPRGYAESAWSGAGSGCSAYEPKPSWQHDNGCARRTVADVAAVADPSTGVAVYDSTPSNGQSGWMVFGGTSVAAPLVSAAYALAGPQVAASSPASFPYTNPTGLYDISSGSNGSCGDTYLCTSIAGYDGPTGLGTPHGAGAFAAPATPAAPVFTAAAPPTSAVTGTPYTYTFTATGYPTPTFTVHDGNLPAGLTLNPATGVLSGTPTTPGGSTFTVTATTGVSPDALTAPITITITATATTVALTTTPNAGVGVVGVV